MRYDNFTIQSESYRKDFWNKMMKGQTAPYETMNKGAISSDTYVLPYDSNRKYMEVLKEECIFRQLATSIKSADSSSVASIFCRMPPIRIYAKGAKCSPVTIMQGNRP